MKLAMNIATDLHEVFNVTIECTVKEQSCIFGPVSHRDGTVDRLHIRLFYQNLLDLTIRKCQSLDNQRNCSSLQSDMRQPYIFTQSLQLILCKVFATLDLLYPLVQLHTHLWD